MSTRKSQNTQKTKVEYPTLITQESILVLKGTKRLFAHSGHPSYIKILDAVRNGRFVNIERLFELKKTIEKCFDVTVKNGSQVFYKNKQLNNVLTDKILNAFRNNLPYKPYIKFLNNLMQNPSEYCREQLFSYVERYGLPIDSNGMTYAWKSVNSKMRDKYTNKISYAPGKTVEMKRENCNQNPQLGCEAGLHTGASSYVLEYGSDSTDRFVLIKFNPKDVISCPTDCQWQKLRVCRLKVVREVKRTELKPLADKYMGDIKRLRQMADKDVVMAENW
jgi:hypothetical protein